MKKFNFSSSKNTKLSNPMVKLQRLIRSSVVAAETSWVKVLIIHNYRKTASIKQSHSIQRSVILWENKQVNIEKRKIVGIMKTWKNNYKICQRQLKLATRSNLTLCVMMGVKVHMRRYSECWLYRRHSDDFPGKIGLMWKESFDYSSKTSASF